MAAHKKNHYLVSALLFALIGLACMNLINCGSTDSTPVIGSMTPSKSDITQSGTVSPSTTTIIGSNFGLSSNSNSYVTFNLVNATVTSWSDTMLIVTVPSAGAGSTTPLPDVSVNANVVVTVNGQASNAVTYTYTGTT
jgi:hypothetical protein